MRGKKRQLIAALKALQERSLKKYTEKAPWEGEQKTFYKAALKTNEKLPNYAWVNIKNSIARKQRRTCLHYTGTQ